MKRLIVLALVFSFAASGLYAAPVAFNDPNLEIAVENELGVTDPNTTDMLSLIFLDARHLGITDITGLETATNLKYLYIADNSISSLTPLFGLTQLKTLEAGYNNITSIAPLTGKTAMKLLYLYENAITDLSPVLTLSNLIELDVSDNLITDFSPVSGLTNLTLLDLSYNDSNDTSVLAGLTGLTDLGFGGNDLKDIGFISGLPQLQALFLSDNLIIEDISNVNDLSGTLTELYLASNNLDDADLDILPQMVNLTSLSLADNAISNIIPLSTLNTLEYLNLNFNSISNINPLFGLVNLQYLCLSVNNIADITALTNKTNLIDLRLAGNDISDISMLAGLAQLQQLRIGYNFLITDISPLTGYTNLTRLDFTNEPVTFESYCIHLPVIVANNPGANITYTPNTHPLLWDCFTDNPDLDVFSTNWCATDCNSANNYCGGADFDKSGGVHLDDYTVFADWWMFNQ